VDLVGHHARAVPFDDPANPASSPASKTRPSGLCGLEMSTVRPPPASAASIPARSKVQRSPSHSIGTWICGRPVSRTTSKNGI
jgi:hypothetical protein